MSKPSLPEKNIKGMWLATTIRKRIRRTIDTAGQEVTFSWLSSDVTEETSTHSFATFFRMVVRIARSLPNM